MGVGRDNIILPLCRVLKLMAGPDPEVRLCTGVQSREGDKLFLGPTKPNVPQVLVHVA